MLGKLLLKIRKDKKISQAAMARESNINVGHLTHIEKGDRYPSHKSLKRMCEALDVPYQQLMYTYDKELSTIQEDYDILNHIAYNSVTAINSLDDMIFCPAKFGTASFALKITDDSMEPKLLKGLYAFIEPNSPLDNKDIGLFYYNGNFVIRRLLIRSKSVTLKADNKNYDDIHLLLKDQFYIVGKILGTNDDY